MLKNICRKTHFWTEDQFQSRFCQLQTAELWDVPEFQQTAPTTFASFCLCFHGLWLLNSISGRAVSYSSFQLGRITSLLYWKAAHKKMRPTKKKGLLESWPKWAVIHCREVLLSFSIFLATISSSASLKKEIESGKTTTQQTFYQNMVKDFWRILLSEIIFIFNYQQQVP